MNIFFKVKTPYTRSWVLTIHCGFVNIFHAAMNAIESHPFAHLSFASPAELNGILFRPSLERKSYLLLSFQFCFLFGDVFSIFILRSFIMTKRDSYIADLPSPRVLRMASSDILICRTLALTATRHLPRLLLVRIPIHKPVLHILIHLNALPMFLHSSFQALCIKELLGNALAILSFSR